MNYKPQITHNYWFIIAAFLILFAPLALNYNFYYPDEVHYNDAAVQMLNNGDYLTPYQGSGELRFNKPIITYWFVLMGFKLFGISAFAARFFFFLSGAIILLLVYRLANLIYSNKKTALLAIAITAGHPTFLMSSMRSIPDILLCLFMTASALGFAGLIKFGNRTPAIYKWLLYLGLALAFEVKGIPAVLLGAAGLAFLALNPWQRTHWKNLLHWPSLSTALIIASSWFIVMFLKYGQEFTQSFYNDQLGERITISIQSISMNIGLSFLILIALFLPWVSFISKPSGEKQKKQSTEFIFQAFAITWIIAVILMSGMVFKFYERYLLPVIPVCAIWLANLITGKIEIKPRLIKLWSLIMVCGNTVFILAAAVFYLNFDNKPLDYIWLIVAILITILVLYNFFKTKNMVWFSISILTISIHISIITHKISFPNEGQQIVQIIKSSNINTTQGIAFIGDPECSSKLRIACKNELYVVNMDELFAEYESESYDILIVSEDDIFLFPRRDFEYLGNSLSWNSSQSQSLILSALKGNYVQQVQSLGKKYYLLKRKSIT